MTETELKGKEYYKIGEVSRLTDVKDYIIRYWVSELPSIKPIVTPTGYRLFKKNDVEIIRTLKRLIYDDGLTLEGAKKRLFSDKDEQKEQKMKQLKNILNTVKQNLMELKQRLDT